MSNLTYPLQLLGRKWENCVEGRPRLLMALTYIRATIISIDLRSAEFLLGALAIITGFWVGWPGHRLEHITSPYYLAMVAFMPAIAWTFLFALAALPLMLPSRNKGLLIARLAGNAMLLSLWVLASLLFMLDNSPHLSTIWTPFFSFYQAWILLALWLKTYP